MQTDTTVKGLIKSISRIAFNAIPLKHFSNAVSRGLNDKTNNYSPIGAYSVIIALQGYINRK